MEPGKNKRALITSFIIHGFLIFLAVFPLVSMVKFDAIDMADSYQVIAISFENGDMSPESSSTRPIEKKTDRIQVEAEISEEYPMVFTKQKNVLLENKEISTVDQSDVDMEKGAMEEDMTNSQDFPEEISDELTDESEELSDGSDIPGEGETGEEITGFALANMDFEGEGIFGRQVVYHANISKLAEKEGRVVVNLCINRIGLVTHVAFNREASTLTESAYVKEVMRVAAKYRFEKDYTAPELQCGKLSFIFKFN